MIDPAPHAPPADASRALPAPSARSADRTRVATARTPVPLLAPLIAAALIVAALALAPRAAAQAATDPAAEPFTLDDAVARAAYRPDPVNARLELLNAETELARIAGDPLALRTDRLQAEHAVTLGRAELERAYRGAVAEIAAAYSGALDARSGLELTERAAELSATSLEVARVRRANGSATDLDVQEAEVALESARSDAATARSRLAVARTNLEGLVGRPLGADALQPVPDAWLAASPGLGAALAAVGGVPELVQARQGLELARVGVDTLDPRYASASQIDAADTRLATTETLVTESRRGFELQARNLVVQTDSAADALRIETDDLANARERLALQRERYRRGLIAELQLRQNELEAAQAEFAHQQARHAYLNALLELQRGTLVPVEDDGAPDALRAGLPDALEPGPSPLALRSDDADASDDAQNGARNGEGDDAD